MSLRPDWLTFGRFAAATTGLTLSLITLGVYTAATGSGLACNAEWPLCSGQLIPALTINPDFIEWFHRFVAMITGFLILGTALWAWIGGQSKRTRLASTLAVVLLPLQISIGAVTVTIGGLVPGGYSVPTHAAHLLVALSIFSLLTLTTLWAYDGRLSRSRGDRLRAAFGVGAIGLAVSTLFSRAVPIIVYDAGAQAWFVVGSLLAFSSLLAALVWAWPAADAVRIAAAIALVSLFVTMLLGRDIVLYSSTARVVNLGLLVLAWGGLAAGYVLLRRSTPESRSGPVSESDPL